MYLFLFFLNKKYIWPRPQLAQDGSKGLRRSVLLYGGRASRDILAAIPCSYGIVNGIL